jgi:hypothetical protein
LQGKVLFNPDGPAGAVEGPSMLNRAFKGSPRGGRGVPPRGLATFDRYGRETVVPSPVAEMLKVPAALLGAYEYACQPVG